MRFVKKDKIFDGKVEKKCWIASVDEWVITRELNPDILCDRKIALPMA